MNYRDPVFYCTNQLAEELNIEEGRWYFWAETWADCEGPFKTRKAAEEALKEYVKQL